MADEHFDQTTPSQKKRCMRCKHTNTFHYRTYDVEDENPPRSGLQVIVILKHCLFKGCECKEFEHEH